MLSSPRRPSSTIRIFSSAEYWRRVLLDYLLRRDLSKFQAKARAPMTASKKSVIATSQSPLETYLRDKFDAEEWPFTGELVVASHLADVLPTSLRANVNNVTKTLERLGGVRLGQKRMDNGTKPMVWAMRRPVIWQQAPEALIEEEYDRPVIEKWNKRTTQSQAESF